MCLNYWQQFEQVVEQFNISKNNICIVGSTILALAKLQKNHDIDFIMHPLERKKFLDKYEAEVKILPSGTINFNSNVQSGRNRYNKIGLVDEELFDDQYSIRKGEYRVARLELEIAQKIERNLQKDRMHLKQLGNSYFDVQGFDRRMFEKLISRKKAIIFGAGENAKKAYYCYCTRFELVCYVDNNERLWGTELNGLMVYSPNILKESDAIIIISSQKHTEEIKKDIFFKYGKRKILTFCMSEELTISG